MRVVTNYSFTSRTRDLHLDEGVNTSIWNDRLNQNHPFYSGSGQSTPQFQDSSANATARSRARAGTLPSRLPPGLPVSSGQSMSPLPMGSLGSLSLLDPPSNQMFPQTLPSSSSTARLNPSNSSLYGLHTQASSSTSSLPNKNYRSDIPFITSSASSQPAQPPQQHSSVSRLRSGSLNDNGRYPSPFGTSIWSSQRSHLQTPVNDSRRTSQTSLLNALEEDHEASATHEIDPQTIDPLQPFYKELTMRTDPSRMRSYTVNNLPYGLPIHDLNDDHVDVQRSQYVPNSQMMPSSLDSGLSSSPVHTLHHARSNPFLGGSRPRAQTTVGSIDGPFPMGNQPMMMSSMASKNGQPQIVYSAQDPVSRDIIVNSFDDSSIGPTRSLWLGNIPASTTSYALNAIFSSYGTVESARVLPHKNCGFVNFVNIESAVQAKTVLNGKELFTSHGPCRVGFAKVVDVNEFEHEDQPAEQQLEHSPPATEPATVEYSVTDKDLESSFESTKSLQEIAGGIGPIVSSLGANSEECAVILASVNRALEFSEFEATVLPVPEPRPDRVYDAPTLREVRKKIDGGLCSQQEVEEIALDILDEIAELSSDYVGNTVVQKLFDICSDPIKDMMLHQIGPHLAQISIHKNGTWAAQKIIGVAQTKRQIDAIARALHPYTVHLFLDQFGNYAIQCCLKFGVPWNDFIFETMLSKFWEIAQGRFGARAMRACLESHHVSHEQQHMMAAAITQHAVQLATNSNGALLLTWFLDTYTAPNRHNILAPKLIPNLVQLCTHKLASLTVLKVINHKAEPEAREEIFASLFNPEDETQPTAALEQILNHSYGPTFIYKVISTPFLGGAERQNAINKIRAVLISIKALPVQGYKRLMDEVGLATRPVQQQPMMQNNRSYQPQPQMRNGPAQQQQRLRANGNGNNGYSPSQGLAHPLNSINAGGRMSPQSGPGGPFYSGANSNDMMMMPPAHRQPSPQMYGQYQQPPQAVQYDQHYQHQKDQLSVQNNGQGVAGRISPSRYHEQQQQQYMMWQQQQQPQQQQHHQQPQQQQQQQQQHFYDQQQQHYQHH